MAKVDIPSTATDRGEPHDDSEQSAQWAGIALIVISFLILVMMTHHPVPSSHDPGEFVHEVQEWEVWNKIVHGSMIVLMAGLFFCLSYLSTRLGNDRWMPRAGMLSYGIGGLAMITAATFSGFVVPGLATSFQGVTSEQFDIVQASFRICREINRATGQLGIVGMSLGVLFWSVAMEPRTGLVRVTGMIGIISGLLCLGGLSTGHMDASVHGMILFVLAQMIWNGAAGLVLIRRLV